MYRAITQKSIAQQTFSPYQTNALRSGVAAAVCIVILFTWRQPACAQSALPSSEFPMPFSLTLQEDEPWSLSGNVVDENGDPVAAADVSLFAEMPDFAVPVLGPLSLGQTTTDEDGTFEIEVSSLPHGHCNQVWAVARGGQLGAEAIELEMRPGEQKLCFILSEQRLLEGKVLTPDGKPASDVQVHLDRMADATGDYLGPAPLQAEAWPRASVTDASGRFFADFSG